MKRPTIHDTFMETVDILAKRSTCLSRQVGAVFVKDGHQLSSGYNGAPTGLTHCLDIGCWRRELKVKSGERMEICRAVHAEQNAIIQAAIYGVSLKGADLYVSASPCTTCAKMLVNLKIGRIFIKEFYGDTEGLKYLKDSGIEIIEYKK